MTSISNLVAGAAVSGADLFAATQGSTGPGTGTTYGVTAAAIADYVLGGSFFNIYDYGAKCDGVTDDGPAIQLAVNAAENNGGGIILFPNATILWNSQVIVNGPAVRLQGQGWSEYVISGTRILTTSTAQTILYFGAIAAAGSGVFSMSFQQTQPTPGAGWMPTAYPYTIIVENVQGTVILDDLFFYNCYQCIYAFGAQRLTIGNIWGQALSTGLYIDHAFDVVRVGQIHWWPYWSQNSYVIAWMQANANSIELLRCDGFQADAIFCYGYKAGILTESTTVNPAGNLNSINLAQIAAFYPDFCMYGLYMQGAYGSMHFGSVYTGGILTSGFSLYLNSTNCTVSIANAKLYYEGAQCIVMDQAGGGNVLLVGNIEFNNFNQNSPNNYTAIYSVNGTTPNIVRIASQPNMALPNGASMHNNQCTTWFSIPGDDPYQIASPTSGSTVQLYASNAINFIEPSATLAALTIDLPALYPPNGVLEIMSTKAITAVTWPVPSGVSAVVNAPSSLSAGQCVRFKFFSSTITAEGANTWYAMI